MYDAPVQKAAMTPPNLNSLDLNLLRVFDAVFRERSILRAGDRLGMSQPATSHALARLRHALKDDLFLRSSRGMLPTYRAEQLAEPVRQALGFLEIGLQAGTFDPATSRQSFTLAFDNCNAIAHASAILSAVSREAPGISLRIRPSGTMNIDQMIDAAELDVFLGREGELRERFESERIAEDDFVVMYRAALEIAPGRKPISWHDLASRPHLGLSSTGDDTGFVDDELEKHGLARTVVHTAPLLACAGVLEDLDVLIVARRPIARALCRNGGLAFCDLPFAAPKVATCMRWHRRLSAQPAHIWLRQTIRAAITPGAEDRRSPDRSGGPSAP